MTSHQRYLCLITQNEEVLMIINHIEKRLPDSPTDSAMVLVHVARKYIQCMMMHELSSFGRRKGYGCCGRRLLRSCLYIKCYSQVKIDKNKIRQPRKQSNSWLAGWLSSMYKKTFLLIFAQKKKKKKILFFFRDP